MAVSTMVRLNFLNVDGADGDNSAVPVKRGTSDTDFQLYAFDRRLDRVKGRAHVYSVEDIVCSAEFWSKY